MDPHSPLRRALGPIGLVSLLLAFAATPAAAQLIGPTPYLGAADSPFDGMRFSYFHIDDMEDGLLNTPGVMASVGAPYGPTGITDSVDEDDGAIDGSGTGGYSFFSSDGLGGIRFTFDAVALGRYPTHVGIVWTDGTDDIEFEAFDASDMSLGTRTGTHADADFNGGTDEDRFYGIVHAGGVKSIVIRNSVPGGGAGIEVDHLQYGAMVELPESPYSLLFDGTEAPVLPLSGDGTAQSFYSYGSPAASSANTGLEKSGTARFWLHQDSGTGEVSLFVVLDEPDDGSGGSFNLTASGAPAGAGILVEDDPSDVLAWDSPAGTGSAAWNWDACCTDGWVVGPLACPWEIVLTPGAMTGIDQLEFLSQGLSEPEAIALPLEGSFTIRCAAAPPPSPMGSCPRGDGFWKQQCAQKGNGSTKYSLEEVTQIAGCADDNSEYFDWSEGGAFAGFCEALDPAKPMNQEKQLKRKFATLLANICAGELQLIAANGSIVSIDRNAPLDCYGSEAGTVDELIGEVDQALMAGDWSAYGKLLECVESINEGVGIPLSDSCSVKEEWQDDEAEDEGRIGAPSPNPFRLSTTFAYSVPGDRSQEVRIGIYDVAGRLVRTIVSGSQAPGRHEVTWDGTDSRGRHANRGVYFVRGSFDGEPSTGTVRVLYLR